MTTFRIGVKELICTKY